MHFSKDMSITHAIVLILVTVTPSLTQESGMFWWMQKTPEFGGNVQEIPTTPISRDSLGNVGTDYSGEETRDTSLLVITQPPSQVTSSTEKGSTSLLPGEPKFNADEGAGCVCVEYYLCDANNKIITNGDGGLLDVRLGDTSCPGVQVCCGLPDTFTPAIPPVTAEVPRTLPPSTCGVRGGGFAARILSDDTDNSTYFAEFPWMLALLKAKEIDGRKEFNIFQCGASLIHPQVALTAAHCVSSRKEGELKIRAGEWDTQSNTEPVPHQERNIKLIIRHPEFYSGALYNDIALLVLDEPLEFFVNVQPICLPDDGAVFRSSSCIATGWGLDTFGKSGKFQMTLKKVELPIVDSDVCQEELRKSRLGSYFRLHKSFVCAGGEAGKDTCKGDGGGPLACLDPVTETYVQVGIVSWGLGCGESGVPSVYTNVAMFRKWIDKNIENFL